MSDLSFAFKFHLSPFDDISSYTISDVEKFADSDYIESYYYTYNVSLNGNNIEKAESEKSDQQSNMPSFPGGGDTGQRPGTSSYDFTLNGYSSLDAMNEFITGTYEMVEIARSLSYNPKMIVADEPTGNLDKQTEEEILEIFKDLAHKDNKCVIIVTHSANVCDQADRVYDLKKVKK